MVAIIIPSYGQFDRLSRCVDSVLRSTSTSGTLELVVVTSGYSPAEVESLKSRGCKVVQLSAKAPTSRSRNIGASRTSADYLMFLDDDNVIAPDAIAILEETLRSSRQVTVVGPAMYYASAPTRLWCAGVRRSRVLMKTTLRSQLPVPAPTLIPSEDLPNCFMVRRLDFETVGGFDAVHFPQQWEEGDLARRLVSVAGGGVFVVPRAKTWHSIEPSLVRRLHMRDQDRAFLVARGRGMFTALHGDRLQWIAYIVAAQWMFAALYLSAALSLPRGARWPVVTGYAKGLWAGLFDGKDARSQRASRAVSAVHR